jgi:prevent-host-death family protein
METVGLQEAKVHFSQLLDRVAQGERITITRHGVPVAVIQQPDPMGKPSVEETIAEIREFRKGFRLGDCTIRELTEEGRR